MLDGEEVRELEIPAEGIRRARGAYDTALDREIRRYSGEPGHAETAALIAAAPFLVAAELRRMARLWIGDAQRPGPIGATPSELRVRTWFQAADGLNDRADQLDPEGRTR